MGYDKTHEDLSKIIAAWGNVNISCDAYQLSQSKQVERLPSYACLYLATEHVLSIVV